MEVLDALVDLAPPPPQPAAPARWWSTNSRWKTVSPDDDAFSAWCSRCRPTWTRRHRDRIAFVRMASGTYTPGMKLGAAHRQGTAPDQRGHLPEPAARGGERGLSPATSSASPPTAACSWATPSPTAPAAVHRVAVLRAELFMTVILKNPLRTKQLQQGLAQLGEEGAIQVFRPKVGGPMLLVRWASCSSRWCSTGLKAEYDADVRLKLPVHRRALDHADTPASRGLHRRLPGPHGARRRRHPGLPVHQPVRRAAGGVEPGQRRLSVRNVATEPMARGRPPADPRRFHRH